MWRSKLPILVNRKEEKEQRKITQQEIAGATQLRQATISAWMNWETFKYLNAAVVAALAEYLDCSPSELYEWIDDEQGEATPDPVETSPESGQATLLPQGSLT